MADYMIIVIVIVIILTALRKKVDIFGEFTKGAAENLRTCADILPTLIGLITAVGMFRASGAADMITELFRGLTEMTGFPSECLPLALIRPVSGSGALAVYEGILRDCHPDSFAGRVASVMIGATETTFYTIAVYYGAVGIKKTKHTLAASLTGDITGFIFSLLTVRLMIQIC